MNNTPIYCILVFQHPDKELLNSNNKLTGWPDMGADRFVGFYYEKDVAVNALHENRCDIRECVYNAAFLYKLNPGLYQSATKDDRTYFVWNEEKKGFFEQPEPSIFQHIAL